MTVDQLYEEAMKGLTESDRLRLGRRLIDNSRRANDDLENAHDEEAVLVQEGGVWVITGTLTEEISDIVERDREERMQKLMAGFKGDESPD